MAKKNAAVPVECIEVDKLPDVPHDQIPRSWWKHIGKNVTRRRKMPNGSIVEADAFQSHRNAILVLARVRAVHRTVDAGYDRNGRSTGRKHLFSGRYWRVDVDELANGFNISTDSAYEALTFLRDSGYIRIRNAKSLTPNLKNPPRYVTPIASAIEKITYFVGLGGEMIDIGDEELEDETSGDEPESETYDSENETSPSPKDSDTDEALPFPKDSDRLCPNATDRPCPKPTDIPISLPRSQTEKPFTHGQKSELPTDTVATDSQQDKKSALSPSKQEAVPQTDMLSGSTGTSMLKGIVKQRGQRAQKALRQAFVDRIGQVVTQYGITLVRTELETVGNLFIAELDAGEVDEDVLLEHIRRKAETYAEWFEANPRKDAARPHLSLRSLHDDWTGAKAHLAYKDGKRVLVAINAAEREKAMEWTPIEIAIRDRLGDELGAMFDASNKWYAFQHAELTRALDRQYAAAGRENYELARDTATLMLAERVMLMARVPSCIVKNGKAHFMDKSGNWITMNADEAMTWDFSNNTQSN